MCGRSSTPRSTSKRLRDLSLEAIELRSRTLGPRSNSWIRGSFGSLLGRDELLSLGDFAL